MMNWITFSPELYFLIMGVVFLGLSMAPYPINQRSYFIALVLASIGVGVSLAGVGLQGDLFFQTYRVDLFSQVFKVMLSMGFFWLCAFVRNSTASRRTVTPNSIVC